MHSYTEYLLLNLKYDAAIFASAVGGNLFMDVSFSELKLNSKKRIFSKGSRIILVGVLFFALLYVMDYLSMRISGYDTYINDYAKAYLQYIETGSESTLENITFTELTVPASALLISISIMQSFANIGYAGYCLTQSRNLHAGFKDIFNSFNFFFRIITISILKLLIMLLYSLPAIIALFISWNSDSPLAVAVMSVALVYLVFILVKLSLQYGLVFYVMFDNPDMSSVQCMKYAKKIIRGHIMQYIGLQLSFIGWYILNNLLAAFFIPIIAIWLNPYQGITVANYYNKLVGKYVVIPQDNMPTGFSS